jgi:HEAT repeat protein
MMPELPGEIDYREIEPLLDDPDDDVRMHATYAYCNYKPGDPFATMGELLEADQPRVRSGALQCIASHAPPDADDQLESVVQQFLSRGAASDRKAVATAAGRRPAPPQVHQHLAPLLADDDPEVRRAAIRSAGATHNQEFMPVLMGQLAVRQERSSAQEALADYGDAVVDTLGRNLVDTGCPIGVRVEIPQVLRRIGTQAAADALMRGLLDDNRTISYRVLKSLNRLRERRSDLVLTAGRIEAQIEWSASRHVRFLLHRTTVATAPRGPARDLLRRVIRERSQQAFQRLFRGLALIYPPRETFLAYRGVTSKNARLHAQAVEYLETILSPEHRQIVLPLIDYPGSSTENMRTRHLSYARLRKSSLLLGVPVLTLHETLTDMVEHGDPWLQSCALYTIGSLELGELVDLVRAMRESDEAAVREMGDWACARLGGNGSQSAD